MPTPIDWIIFYADGSTFSNLDGEPYESPMFDGVICIAQNDDARPIENIGRRVMSGRDHYYFHPEFKIWFGCNEGDFQRLVVWIGPATWRPGMTLPNDEYKDIIDYAKNAEIEGLKRRSSARKIGWYREE